MPNASPTWPLELLALFRRRPGMFLGSEDVETLSTFLFGYAAALTDFGDPSASAADELLADFEVFLRARDPAASALSWIAIVKQEHQNGPEFPLFEVRRSPTGGSTGLLFSLYDLFLKVRGIKEPEAASVGRIFGRMR